MAEMEAQGAFGGQPAANYEGGDGMFFDSGVDMNVGVEGGNGVGVVNPGVN